MNYYESFFSLLFLKLLTWSISESALKVIRTNGFKLYMDCDFGIYVYLEDVTIPFVQDPSSNDKTHTH